MLDKKSDFCYVSFRNDSGEPIDLDLSVDLLPLRTVDEHAILAGKDIAFLYESITERKFAAAIGSADDIVSFSRRLVAPSFHGFDVVSTSNVSPPVSYALDESVSIPRVVYTDRKSHYGSWDDLFDKASVPRVTVKELPSVDRIIRKKPVLAAFDNQSKLNRFYTPNLSAARDATNMRVNALKESVQVSVADTDSCYPNSENNIYPPSVTASTDASSVYSEDGEIVALEQYERTSYNGTFNLYGHDGSPKGFLRNEWHSYCYNFAAKTGYDLYLLAPRSVNIAPPGAKYRAVFYFSYRQSYAVSGFEDSNKNISGSSDGRGYLIGDETTVPEHGIKFVPRSNVFTFGILNDIRKHYQGIDPVSEGFLSATNVPNWYALSPPYPTDGNVWQVIKKFSRRYDASIVLKPMGYIVTLGNHTRWKS